MSVLRCSWLGGGNNSISAAKCSGVQPLIPYTHLLRANAIGECYTPTPFSIEFLSSLAEYDGYLLMTFD